MSIGPTVARMRYPDRPDVPARWVQERVRGAASAAPAAWESVGLVGRRALLWVQGAPAPCVGVATPAIHHPPMPRRRQAPRAATIRATGSRPMRGQIPAAGWTGHRRRVRSVKEWRVAAAVRQLQYSRAQLPPLRQGQRQVAGFAPAAVPVPDSVWVSPAEAVAAMGAHSGLVRASGMCRLWERGANPIAAAAVQSFHRGGRRRCRTARERGPVMAQGLQCPPPPDSSQGAWRARASARCEWQEWSSGSWAIGFVLWGAGAA